MSKIVFILSIVFFISACGDGQVVDSPVSEKVTGGDIASISVEEFNLGIEDEGIVVLDVRTSQEFTSGAITEDAQNLDFYSKTFAQDLGTLDKSQTYYVYCRSGNRSGQTLALMRSQGFERVYELTGGIAAWQSAGLPVH